MNKTIRLLILVLPFIFVSGCIEGQATININKNGSGSVSFEGLFDYPSYSNIVGIQSPRAEAFFLEQIKSMMSKPDFAGWKNVDYKLLDNGKFYFKATAFFGDINNTNFYAGSVKSNFKLIYNQTQPRVLRLKYQPDENSAAKQLLSLLNVRLIVSVPGKIGTLDNFKQLDSQSAMLIINGSKLDRARGRIFFAPDGNDFFDFGEQAGRARKETEKIIETIDERLSAINVRLTPGQQQEQYINFKMRQGSTAEARRDCNDAIKIYQSIADDSNLSEKFRSSASYQIGACLLRIGQKDKAEAQFEYVINTFPLQTAALKSVRMLRIMRTQAAPKEELPAPYVAETMPEVYWQDVDANLSQIKITFSQPMKETGWFYSSFGKIQMPESDGVPAFDPCGVVWTLPVKLETGTVYAIAINYSEKETKNSPASFVSLEGQKCKSFILLFSTADADGEATEIDEELINECEKINSSE